MTAPHAMVLPAPDGEAGLAARWRAGLRGALRLEDGRAIRVIFPGTPAGASGPDFTGAVLDAEGDMLRGDVEIHLVASGWRAHGHHHDPAYAGVILHVVGHNDGGALSTWHASGRSVPLLVLRNHPQAPFPPPFTPPCALAAARGAPIAATLARLGERRMRIKAVRAGALLASVSEGQALYLLLLETLGGAANRAAFATIGRALPLAALLDRAESSGVARTLALTAELKGAAARAVLRRAGLRPMASPVRRLEAAAALIARLWPAGAAPAWPDVLLPGPGIAPLLRAPGIGRAMAIELAVNALLPVAIAAGRWDEASASAAFAALPSPGTYGRLRLLERWLGPAAARPFAGARQLQGGLLLHADYCTKGACGRCPIE